MSINKICQFLVAAILLCGTGVIISCSSDDSDSDGGSIAKPAVLKQGIWTEYDTVLVASGKYTMEQLAQMPTVGMWIEGDKGYFFTYTGEETSEPVEGQVSYDNTKGKGSITFPTIIGNPLSGQTVNFKMTSDETMEFELSYGGQTTTANFAWLCENMDNWFMEITDEDWKELMAYYQTISEKAGPDPSIDWGDLDEPLVWDDNKAATRAENSSADPKVKTPENVFSSIFKPDPLGDINDKLDDLMEKIEQVLENQKKILEQLDNINKRLIAIANKLNQQETVNIFNTRNKDYYIPLDGPTVRFFDDAFDLYKNKKSLSQEDKDKLGEYAKAWAGAGNKYVDLTWNYMKYLTTVQHSTYGTGMDRIYDGMTFDKYPWEHQGTGDRLNYRAYDLAMIAKCLFMISLYAQYGGLSDIEKEGHYKAYIKYTPQLLAFCEFKITNPDEFRVCQIPGAHFVMHRELQEYKYSSDAPDPRRYGRDAIYMPRWHVGGNIKIENPELMKKKLIPRSKMDAILNYFKGYSWVNALIEGHDNSGGARCTHKPGSKATLLLFDSEKANNNGASFEQDYFGRLRPVDWGLLRIKNVTWDHQTHDYIDIECLTGDYTWDSYDGPELFYAAIVERHY